MASLIASWGTIADTNRWATQVKVFHDGTQYWYFYWKSGTADTLFYAYSSDLSSWTESSVSTSGVVRESECLEVLWDSSTSTVLVFMREPNGTTPHHLYIRGVVNPASHSITWDTLRYVWTGNSSTVGRGISAAQMSDGKAAVLAQWQGQDSYAGISTNAIGQSFADTPFSGPTVCFTSPGTELVKLLAYGSTELLGVGSDYANYTLQINTYSGGSWGTASSPFTLVSGDYVNWNVCRISDSLTFLLYRYTSNTWSLRKSTDQGASWTIVGVTEPGYPTDGLATNSGVALVSDGTDMWAVVIRGDANNSVAYNKYTVGTNTWSGWTDLVTSAQTRSYVAAVLTNSKIVITWNQVNGSNYETYVDSVSLTPTPGISDRLQQSDSMVAARSGVGAPTYGDAAAGNGVSSLGVPYPSPLQKGDLLVVWAYARANVSGAWSQPAGWSQHIASTATANGSYAVYYKYADGTETGNLTLTANTSNNSELARMFRFPGGATITSGTEDSAESATPYVNAGVTPVQNRSIVVLVGGTQDCITNGETDGFATWSGGTNVGTWTGVSYGTTGGLDAAIGVGWAQQTTAAATGNIQVTLQASQNTYNGVSVSFAIEPSYVGFALDTLRQYDEVLGANSATSGPQGSVTDTLTESDSQSYNKAVSGNVSDTFTESDATLGTKSVAVSQDDTFTESDSQAHAAAYAGTISDSLTESDSQAYNKAAGWTISDIFTESDSQAYNKAAPASLSDTFTESDSQAYNKVAAGSISDSITESDSVAIQKWTGPTFTCTSTTRLATDGAATGIAATVSAVAGDMLVAVLVGVEGGPDLPSTISDTQSLAWSSRQSQYHTAFSYANRMGAEIWTAPVNSSISTTVTCSYGASTTRNQVLSVFVVSGSGLAVGNTAGRISTTTSDPDTLSITTAHDMALVLGGGVGNAAGGTQTPLNGTFTQAQAYDGSFSTAPASFNAYAPSAGARDVGYSDPYNYLAIAAIEVFSGLLGTVSDTFTESDAVTANRAAAHSISDTFTESDALVVDRAAGHAVSDTFTESDALTVNRAAAHSISDTFTESDSQSADLAAAHSISDTFTESDAVTGTFAALVSISDALTESDEISATKSADKSGAVSDSLDQNDAVSGIGNANQQGLPATLPFTMPYYGKERGYILSDSLAMSDAMFLRAPYVSQGDRFTQSDSQSHNRAATVSVSDSLAETDAIQGQKDGAFGVLADTFTESDSQTGNRATADSIADTFTESDSQTGNRAALVSIGDTFSESDSQIGHQTGLVSISDAFAESDTQAVNRAAVHAVSDTFTESDALQGQKDGAFGVVSDTLTQSDSQAYNKQVSGTIADTLTQSDSQDYNKRVSGAVSDALTESDSQAVNRGATYAISDTFTESDSQAYNKIVSGAVSDTFTESDATQGQKDGAFGTISDSSTQSDQVLTNKAASSSIADTLTQTDAISLAVGWTAAISDTLTQSDSAIALTKGIGVSISDAITALDSMAAARLSTYGAVSDTLTVTDGLLINIAGGFAIPDTLTATDSVTGNSSAKQGAVAETLTQSDSQQAAAYAGTGGSNFFVWNGSAWV